MITLVFQTYTLNWFEFFLRISQCTTFKYLIDYYVCMLYRIPQYLNDACLYSFDSKTIDAKFYDSSEQFKCASRIYVV